jgi:hypothetical protein
MYDLLLRNELLSANITNPPPCLRVAAAGGGVRAATSGATAAAAAAATGMPTSADDMVSYGSHGSAIDTDMADGEAADGGAASAAASTAASASMGRGISENLMGPSPSVLEFSPRQRAAEAGDYFGRAATAATAAGTAAAASLSPEGARFSRSPLGHHSQRLLQSPQRSPRKIPKAPFKVWGGRKNAFLVAFSLFLHD